MQQEVFTLEEVAGYLRLPPEMVERQARQGLLPGRRIEDTWRFSRSGIDDWLRHDGRAIFLQQAGALADDEMMAELRENIYAARGRAET